MMKICPICRVDHTNTKDTTYCARCLDLWFKMQEKRRKL